MTVQDVIDMLMNFPMDADCIIASPTGGVVSVTDATYEEDTNTVYID
jgi:hypothetical protein